ncbi:predicted protein [Naegleria gruberi]|uniref:Predicted protein n=1 Tax=Naegleria gruberi TaxID=5762 RepID=D2VLT0_NAEGR|nr:uncharacterized protein NAEGRDRAFT_50617 [Naegleria gruberi]EFC42197.1 predicted protein [Naegleria gruberi]|eukprot:XP_002674941.1 predicted protein [Naegleria gruberi strain NEG-M]
MSQLEAWERFRQFDFANNEQWKQYLENLTLPENLSEQQKINTIAKYKKKFYSARIEKLNDFVLPYTQIEIPATAGKHDATIIFMHGLGDSGSGWSDVFKKIKKMSSEFDCVKVILPNASEQFVSLTQMSMPSWYDLLSLSIDGAEDVASMDKCFNNVTTLIEREICEFGIKSERIILGGFSQGGSVAFYHGLTNKYKLGGIIVLSSWLPNRKNALTFVGKDFPNKTTPVFQAHGTSDVVVRYDWGATSMKFVVGSLLGGEENAKHYTFKTYSGMGHSSSLTEMNDMAEFIKSSLKL